MKTESQLVKVSDDLVGTAIDLISRWVDKAKRSRNEVSICLSGGKTPLPIYSALGQAWQGRTDLKSFWGDERCVPIEDRQSNYGAFQACIAPHNATLDLFPMYSGGDPLAAAHRYTELLSAQFPNRNLPTFDITLLGMGEDGHTASLFPGMVSPDLIEKTCVAVYAGEQHGWRISLTPGIFNRSENILILAAGRSKGRLIRQILEKSKFSEQLPISWIKPVTGSLTWLVDTAAGSQI